MGPRARGVARAAARRQFRLGSVAHRGHRSDDRARRARAVSGAHRSRARLIEREMMRIALTLGQAGLALAAPVPAHAADGPAVFGVPIDFVLFGLTLLGVALFQRHTLRGALTGLAVISLFKPPLTRFKARPGGAGLAAPLPH